LLDMGSRLSLPRSAQQLLARNAGWSASCLFSQAFGLIGQALIQWRGLLYAASLLHGTTPHSEGGSALAFSSPIAATGGAVMVEFGPPWIGSQFTSAHSERGYVGWVERSETHQ